MAFKTLITNQVNSAFNLIQDLAEDITFTNNSVSEYNFETGETTQVDGAQVIIKGVISKMSKDINDNTMMIAEVILKTEDASAVDIDNYDIISFRNKTWNVNSVDDNGFAVTLNVARKV